MILLPWSAAKTMNRRNFLQSASALAVAAPAFAQGAEKTIRVGIIGAGRRARNILRSMIDYEGTEIVAVSEVYKPNLDQILKVVPNAQVYPDFRDLIADKSIDAVIIASPDHWHPYMCIEACKAGKDVYVEKPISVTVHEGQMMVKAARKYNRIVQVGTQQRSAPHFQKAADIVQSGRLGKVTLVRTWNYSNQTLRDIGNPPDTDPPADLDWNMWLGPAPERPYNKNRFGVHPQRYSDFRWFWDYAGGMMTDWGIHLLDIVLLAMDEPGPRAVSTMGGKYAIGDNRETPDTIQATYEFPNFVCVYENRIANAESMFDEGYGILFHGTEGTLFVDRRRWEVLPETREMSGETLDRIGAARSSATGNSTRDHWIDFVESIRSREQPVSDILIGHRSTATALLGNVALRSRQRFDWDPIAETTENKEAQSFLQREHRAPWKLEL